MSLFNATAASQPMHPRMPDFVRLALLVQRLVDAELLRDAESAALLAQAEAARRSLQEGNADAARHHVEQIVRFTEALVGSEALAPLEGRAVLTTANAFLSQEADGGA